ncbi:FimV/HubP family polar landmark protein [Halopseudomonas yangmingensis]|uniref:Pilus assembly protein FimV n=1 Tax=Halopseudomonas yangmingensis TaxID=1720063 RepID=A0A1I4SSA2_9GAMM|nr:FimV/HubP family polar landmark protein [Halopseudomonas yangmingensis]SFM67291.1 pilus assembly protein FimV [Halopseudomonas yangmingensis]
MVRKLVLAVAAASALMSSGMVNALGVGDIKLRSTLNQPLDAEIELLQLRDLTSTEILPRLASPDDFGRAGIDRSFFLTDLTFTPVVRPDGKGVIRVTSNRPVREPFLSFLMEVRWPSGRVLREFTLLLDPPLYQPVAVTASAPAVPAAQAAPVRQAPVTQAAPRQAASVAAPSPAAAPRPADGRMQTSRNDTLWGIASRHAPAGASVHQTMLAIQDLNPQAFINGNINQMRANQQLQLPDASQANSRSRAEALAEVQKQNQAWQSRTQPTGERQLDARQRDTAAPAPATAPRGDTLRLVAGTSEQVEGTAADGTGTGNAAADARLRDTLDMTKEQLDAAEREKQELNTRLQQLEGQLDAVQRLLELKDGQLASLQQQLAQVDAGSPQAQELTSAITELENQLQESMQPVTEAESEGESEVVAADAEAIADVLPVQADSEAEVSDEAPAVAQDSVAVTETAESPVVLDQQSDPVVAPASEPVSQPASAPVQPVAPSQSLLQQMMQNQMLMLGGGVVAILLLLLLLMNLSRRNARREAEIQQSYRVAQQPDELEPVAEDDSFAAAFDQVETAAAEEDTTADLLANVEAMIAYGKLDEAEALLVDVLQAEPDNADVRLKLLEVQALKGNAEGYVEQARQLERAGGHADSLATMHARFPVMAAMLAGGVAAAQSDAQQSMIEDMLTPQNEPAASSDDIDLDFDFSEFEQALESDGSGEQTEASIDLTDALPVAGESAESDQGFDLDFDLSEFDDVEKSAETTGATAEQPTEAEADPFAMDDGFGMDLGFDLDAPAIATESELDIEDLPDLQGHELNEITEDEPAAPVEPVVEEDLLDLDGELSADDLLAAFDAEQQVQAPPSEPEQDLDTEMPSLSDEDLENFADEFAASLDAEAEEIGLEAAQPSAPAESELEVSSAEQASESDEDFDFLADTDECSTKLDLARAYIDMGDDEGARDILGEVLEEGNDQQQQEARTLMEQLG